MRLLERGYDLAGFLEMFREILRDSPKSFDEDFAGNVLSGLVWRF